MVRFSEIQQFLDFLELLPRNIRTICLRFENFEILGLLVSAQCFVGYPITSNFVKNTPLRVVFSTLLAFGNVFIRGLSRLMRYFLKELLQHSRSLYRLHTYVYYERFIHLKSASVQCCTK